MFGQMSKFQPMRLFILALCLAVRVLCLQRNRRPCRKALTVPVNSSAAEAGKDVVHQLNNAFAKVFETVAPSVVIIEISKKANGESSAFDDLFFQGPPDENNPRRNPGTSQPVQSEGRASSFGRTATSSRIFMWSREPTRSR